MARKKAIEQYRGTLTPGQVANGMNAALRNAKNLVSDAKILLTAGRPPSACALAILAIEEAGKISLLRILSMAETDAELKQGWADYRSHQSKNAMWIIFELVKKGARTLADLRPVFDANSDHTAVLDVIKQLGFYSDCYGQGRWSEPHTAVDEELAKTVIFIAEMLSKGGEVTQREVELWVSHVGPYRNTSLMKQGLLDFTRAMEAEGLGKHTVDEMKDFITGVG